MRPLSNRTLADPPPETDVPRYDRSRVVPGIVHIGVGNFHRTHQAVFMDRCLHLPGHAGWGIVGIGLGRSPEAADKADAFRDQDHLYTVTEYAPDGNRRTRIVGAMIGYLHAPREPDRVLDMLASPGIRIVTLTITESGYNIDERTGEFRSDAPEIARDLGLALPETVFGLLVEALDRRRRAGTAAFATVSCDNLRGNGDTTRKAVVGFARARDPELASWIEREATFPNSMVDRIAPMVALADRDRLNAASGIDDRVPAMSESFIQWVMEDRFPGGRPDLAAAGVQLRDDVASFEAAKGRILNAAHMMLSYPALLCGHRLVHEAMRDSRIRGMIDRFLTGDAIPLIEGPPGVCLAGYKDIVLDRFSNPAIGDQLLRIAQDGAAKIPNFHRRTIERLLETGGALNREAFFLACFARYLDGTDDRGGSYQVIEPSLSSADREALHAPDGLGLLRIRAFAGLGLDRQPGFVTAYRAAVAAIAGGVGAALAADDGHVW